jgi:ectoine hydroxylase-related dioxygenase (phytanoyl-CoA dioxygenase family)
MFMHKPAHKGTLLPWHQNRWRDLDRDPLLAIYTALDPTTVDNSCVQIIPGSHERGVIHPGSGSGFLTDEQIEEYCADAAAVYVELKAGEVVLLHNWLLHRSDVN